MACSSLWWNDLLCCIGTVCLVVSFVIVILVPTVTFRLQCMSVLEADMWLCAMTWVKVLIVSRDVAIALRASVDIMLAVIVRRIPLWGRRLGLNAGLMIVVVVKTLI